MERGLIGDIITPEYKKIQDCKGALYILNDAYLKEFGKDKKERKLLIEKYRSYNDSNTIIHFTTGEMYSLDWLEYIPPVDFSSIEKQYKDKYVSLGIWHAITEFAYFDCRQAIEDVIKSMGFTYEQCLSYMDNNGTNNDILLPIVNAIFDKE